LIFAADSMTEKALIKILFLIVFCTINIKSLQGWTGQNKPDKKLRREIRTTDGFVALWDFHEKTGLDRESCGKVPYPLREQGGKTLRIKEGPVSGYSIKLDGRNYLSLANSATGSLNIYGEKSEVTVIAWIKWSGEQTGFIAGMWNEFIDGGRRQYGLFVSLPYYNGRDQVCGHISLTGKPTPPFPYSIDYSASGQKVPADEWCSVAFTYDGQFIRSYFNGEFMPRMPELINNTAGFEGYPDGLIQSKNPYYFPFGIGNNGSDFTVGAVTLKSGMGNFFKGLIGGVAVFRRALSEKELKAICRVHNLNDSIDYE
jgi:hypothetical protein